MFDRFVPSDDDAQYLLGLVAYALYKAKKREWATEFLQKKGRRPDRPDIDDYTASWTGRQIDATRKEAEQALSEYAEVVIEVETPSILRQALRGGFWKSVGASLLAATLYTGALVVLAVLASISGIDLLSIYERLTHR